MEPDANVIPVVFLGGTGVNMYTNIIVANEYLFPKYSNDKTIAFDTFSFSYRGYPPNVGPDYMSNENNIISDSKHFFEYVKGLYPTKRPLLLSHSLGTGPTTALAEYYRDRDAYGPSCVGLGESRFVFKTCVGERGRLSLLLLGKLCSLLLL